MKKIILIFSLVFYTTANAQIKKTSVKVNNKQTQQANFGVLLKSNVKLKSLQDLNKLNIPLTQITSEKLNAKPTQSWEITPLKLIDGVLKLDSFSGNYGLDYWRWFTDTNFSELENGTTENRNNKVLPITIKFRATGGVEYRLKINQRLVLPTREFNFIYIKKGNLISKVQMSSGLEFNYIFKETRSGEIEISISGVVISAHTNSGGSYPIHTEKIEIDRIN